ncbi:hypothetical protein BGX30_000643 [Mortierella sp. GBA39]|nr:hypothetical protein BGX30_000643 [Mortierella sp. GBA39]
MLQLRHVKIGAYAALYILQNLTTIAPQITSFVYSGGFEEDLMLDWNMRDSAVLRIVLRAFPLIRDMILPVRMGNLGDQVPVVAKKRPKASHDHLENITGHIVTDLPLFNVRLSNIKQFGSISSVKSDEELVVVLTGLSALKHLEVDVLESSDTFLQFGVQPTNRFIAILATDRALTTVIVKGEQ